MKKRGDNESRVLKPEQKALLHECIAQYLDRNGFSKTLNKFRKEAQFQKQNDGLGGSSFDLEDVFCKYLEICDKGDSNVIEKQSGAGDKHIGLKVADEEAVATDIKGEDKKRMKKNSDSLGTEEQGKADSAVPQSPAKKCKDKKKKKSKLDNESPDNTADHSLELLPGTVVEKSTNKKLPEGEKVTDSQIDNKPKNKKKKKNDLSLPEIISGGNLKDHDREKPSQGIELDTSKDEVTDKKNKGSKKRKRLATEEDGAQHADEKAAEESKYKKTKRSEEQNGNGHFSKLKSASETNKNNQKEGTGEVISRQSEKMSTKKHDEPVNGNLEKSGKESSTQKTTKMQRNASVEPKTVNHFQRVKVEEVVFSDERLQDNSYWAKDGAENGYGAKAQEVLGQVKGRGFRHEKTKKKRGTYRGGEIDLQSHSVKFNYSDDE